MMLYHFRDAEFGLRSLKERRLKIARIMELNDPFEFLGMELSNPDLRRGIEATKKQISEETGIICFSKNWQNPVQWSHYAEKHIGICMAFDVPGDCPMKVNYEKERLPVTLPIDEGIMRKYLTTKFHHWKYEEEYRLFTALNEIEEESGLYFLNFSNNLQLKKVMVGYRSEITRKQLANALGDISQDIEVFKVRPAFKAFKVVQNKNETLWI